MNIKSLSVIVVITILTFSALYAPQPLLPVFSSEFLITKSVAALMTTFTLLPLSFSPFIYGFILESVSARKMIIVSVFLLSMTEILVYFSHSFNTLLAIRLLQGFLIPAVLTSLMTYVSKLSESKKLQKSISLYISATIVGGFLGRAVSGFISYNFGWRYSFFILFISLFLSVFLLLKLKEDVRVSNQKIKFQDVVSILKIRKIFFSYLGIFFLFSSFAGLLNFLPARVTETYYTSNEFKIGLLYSGYLVGVLMSFFSAKMVARFGYKNIFRWGVGLFFISIWVFFIPSIFVYYMNMFLLCGSMFLVHSSLSGFVNKFGGEKKGILNGLYVSFYYSGGVVGSYFPGVVYEIFGWNAFLSVLIFFSVLSFSFLSNRFHNEY